MMGAKMLPIWPLPLSILRIVVWGGTSCELLWAHDHYVHLSLVSTVCTLAFYVLWLGAGIRVMRAAEHVDLQQ